MKSDKVVRQIDELGRVVIPRDMRRELGLSCGDKIAFQSDDSKIIISKLDKSCALCGSKHGLVPFNDKYLCTECLKSIKTIIDW